VFVIAGEPADLLAGRFTRVPSGETNDHNRPFFDDGAAALRGGAAILVPQAFGDREFRRAVNQEGASEVAPGVALLRGPAPSAPIAALAPLQVVPTTEAGVLQAVALVGLLGLAGLGWAMWFLGSSARPLVVLSVAPTAGAAVLMFGALVLTKLGLHPAETAGVVMAVIVSAAGFGLASAARFRARARPAPGATSASSRER